MGFGYIIFLILSSIQKYIYIYNSDEKKSAFFRKISINVLQNCHLFLSSTGFGDHTTLLELTLTLFFKSFICNLLKRKDLLLRI